MKRKKGISLSFPIVYGSAATPVTAKHAKLPKDLDPSHTHVWTVYFRSADEAKPDLSWMLEKVQFQLHESFPQARRAIASPPYEVTESGWGEFEVPIKVFFRDPHEKPVSVYHHLRLFPVSGTSGKKAPGDLTQETVVWERYDEIVFENPTEEFYELYLQNGGEPVDERLDVDEEAPPKRVQIQNAKFHRSLEQAELRTITAALEKVQRQLGKFQEKAVQITGDLGQMRKEMDRLETSELLAADAELEDVDEDAQMAEKLEGAVGDSHAEKESEERRRREDTEAPSTDAEQEAGNAVSSAAEESSAEPAEGQSPNKKKKAAKKKSTAGRKSTSRSSRK